MMRYLDDAVRHLEKHAADRAGFEQKHGRTAAAMLPELPSLLRFFNRVTFDLSIPFSARAQAALATQYLLEPEDFLREGGRHATESLVDDMWLAYRVLQKLLPAVEEKKLAAHWKGTTPFAEVVGYAHNVDTVAPKVPSRVLDLLKDYLGDAH